MLNIADEVADNKIKHNKLIEDNSTKLANKIMILADQVDTAQDIRHLVEANDKLSITLKVNERHSPKTEINNQNLTQNNKVIKVEYD